MNEVRCENCGALIEDEPGVKFTVTPKTPAGEQIPDQASTLTWCDENVCMLAALEEIEKSGLLDPPKPGEWDEIEFVLDDDTVLKVTQPGPE